MSLFDFFRRGFGTSGAADGPEALPKGRRGFGTSGAADGPEALPKGRQGFGTSGAADGPEALPKGRRGFGTSGAADGRETLPKARRDPRGPSPELSPKDNPLLAPLLASLAEGVLAVDHDRRVILASPALAPILNRSPETALGHPLWESLRHHELGAALDRVLTDGGDETRELAFPPEGRIYRVHLRPFTAARRRGALLAFLDITRAKALEEQRKEFVANVSHELKTPLAALRAALETLMDGALEDTAHARDFLGTAQEQVERLQRLIDDLLTLSRLEKPGAPAPAGCAAAEVAERVRAALAPVAKKAGITLALAAEPAAAPLTADELTQVLMNLVDNAVKFNRPGGRVDIAVKKTADGVEVSVADDGPGIAPEHRSRVFERFYRVEKSRNRDQGGTGLGLAIVKHIVENRGGKVRLESSEKGSVFTARFPS